MVIGHVTAGNSSQRPLHLRTPCPAPSPPPFSPGPRLGPYCLSVFPFSSCSFSHLSSFHSMVMIFVSIPPFRFPPLTVSLSYYISSRIPYCPLFPVPCSPCSFSISFLHAMVSKAFRIHSSILLFFHLLLSVLCGATVASSARNRDVPGSICWRSGII